MKHERKYVYEVVRQWRDDYELDTEIASDYDKAVEIANRWVDDCGYSCECDGDDMHFGSDGILYKCYGDDMYDSSVRIWLEQKEIH